MRGYDQNIMVILSSPSGVGKTTLTKKIQQKYHTFKISVSHTTRLPRSNEVDGVDYHFINHDKFQELIKNEKLYEFAKIFGNYYGTSKDNVDTTIKTNDILFDIDWQGTKQLDKFKHLKLIKIFLITSKKSDLKNRLEKRNQNTREELEKRLNSFEEEIKHWKDYDYIIINENLETCFKQIENIILNNKKSFTFPHKFL